MEIEYKWDFPEGDVADVLGSGPLAGCAGSERRVEMRAVYYDTADGFLTHEHIGLRVRRENERSVCCMKTPAAGRGGAKTRNEFEVEADDVFEGLRLLSAAGAPRGVCERVLRGALVVSCETAFTRRAFDIERDGLSAELAFDEGRLCRRGRQAPIRELELEHVGGPLAAFHSLAMQLERELGLVPEPQSKLARALAL